ncbi:MAG: hypothetical protein OEM82_05560 [Acidobacteriota bacterium]|nr:hypothetical protein [Acidobacteriota bacterium]MDH3530437.1 hypothetical protein [Acidobacteriota bacterium]
MSQEYQPGDYLIFQIESGYGLLRLLGIETLGEKRVWHIAAYGEMFLDIDSADSALADAGSLTVTHPHLALTTRAFESTQTSRMANIDLNPEELEALRQWRESPDREISDRSVRLLLGMR